MIRTRHVIAIGLAMAPAVAAFAQAKDEGKDKQVDVSKPAGTEAANISTVGDWFKFNTNVTASRSPASRTPSRRPRRGARASG